MNSTTNNTNPASSDMIIQTLNDYVEKYQNGLCLMELPTSIGKTYSTFEWIAQYAERWAAEQPKGKKRFRQVIFVTTMKKNLMTPEFDVLENDEETQLGELEQAYNRHGRREAYKVEVMVLKSVADTLESIHPILTNKEKTIPSHYRNLPLLDSLKGRIAQMTGEAAKSDKNYKKITLREANKTYFNLRKEIVNRYKELKGIDKKVFVPLSEVAEDDNKWVFDLFPDLAIPKKKVLLMSFSKLLMGRLYEGTARSFLSEDFLKNKIIFVDEFDSTKKTLKDALADNSILNAGEGMDDDESGERHPFNFLQMFMQIHRGAPNLFASEDLTSLADQNKSGNSSMITRQYIMEESERLNKNYSLDHAYLADDELRDDRNVFIFQDYATRTIVKGNFSGRLVGKEADCNRVVLSVKTKEEMDENDFYIDGLVRWLRGFVKRFALHALAVGRGYAEKVNERTIDRPEAQLTEDEGFRSYLSKYHISRGENTPNIETKVLWNMAVDSNTAFQSKNKRGRLDYDYYVDGFTYYNIESRKSDNDSSILSMVSLTQTAESIMAKICQNALVFGVSATAGIPSVTGNYNLAWMSEALEGVHDMTAESLQLSEWVQEFMHRRYLPYENGEIAVQLHAIKSMDDIIESVKQTYLNGSSAQKPCTALSNFDNRMAWEIENAIIGSLQKIPDKTDYLKLRYYNLANVMRDFASKTSIQSLLCLGKQNAVGDVKNKPDGSHEWDKWVIAHIAKCVNADLKLAEEDKIDVTFIYSDGFIKTMEEIQYRLSDTDKEGNEKRPERLVIISAYDSVSVGQNMQYPAPRKFRENLVCLTPRGEINEETYSKKDIDAIYLGDITHLTTNFGKDCLTEKDLVMAVFQAEELNADGEITSEEKENHVRNAFNNRFSAMWKPNELRRTDSIKSEMTRTVIQAVGRIGRSNQRCREVNIYIDNKVIKNLHLETLCQKFMTPEMRALACLLESDSPCKMEKKELRELVMSNTISDKAAEDINSLLGKNAHRGEWSAEDIRKWEEWRWLVAKFPTASEEEKAKYPFINSYYISNKAVERPAYLFSVNGRYYAHQRVWWGDITSFKNADRRVGPYNTKGDDFGFGREDAVIMTMSEENSGLPIILKYKGRQQSLKDWWTQQGLATSFKNKPYILCPFLYTEILKGMYGELAGKFIVENETDLLLEGIVNPWHFEKADFKVKDHEGWYVDFKFYSAATQKDNEKELTNIFNKLNILKGERMFVVNVIKGDAKGLSDATQSYFGDRIKVIPWLIDEEGRPNPDIAKSFI